MSRLITPISHGSSGEASRDPARQSRTPMNALVWQEASGARLKIWPVFGVFEYLLAVCVGVEFMVCKVAQV